jgi:hypothetical protein
MVLMVSGSLSTNTSYIGLHQFLLNTMGYFNVRSGVFVTRIDSEGRVVR